MDFEASVRSKIITISGVTSYTSNRVYPLSAPQEAKLPHITYYQVSDIPHHAMITDPSIRESRLQVSTWSTSYSQAKTVARALRTALRDFSGVLATSGVTAQRIFYDGSVDMMEIDPETNAKTYHIPQDFIVWYTT